MFLDCRLCNDVRLDKTIHSLFHPYIEKAVDLIIHEVVLFDDVLRYQSDFDLVLIILRYWVVEVEVIDGDN